VLIQVGIKRGDSEMSLDLVLYTACAIGIPADLPDESKWANNGEYGWVYDGGTWLVRLSSESNYSIPSEAMSLNPELHQLVVLMLEGSAEDGAAFMDGVVASIVRKCGSAVLESDDGYHNLEL
jgi:hypothetical protein